MADTPPGETATPAPLENSGTPTPAPVTDNKSQDVEQAKRETEQARMRANQLENELKAERDKQAAAERKQLEEKEEYKALYEKSEADRQAIVAEREAETKKTQLEAKQSEVFAKFPADVVEVAKTAGLGLTDTTDTAAAQLSEKLQSIADKVSSPGVSGNNPAPRTEGSDLRSEEVLKSMRYGNKDARRAYIQQSPSIKAVKEELQRQAGVTPTR